MQLWLSFAGSFLYSPLCVMLYAEGSKVQRDAALVTVTSAIYMSMWLVLSAAQSSPA